MSELAHLISLAFKAELRASRKLAASSGMDEEQALRATLECSAAPESLAQLLAGREALRNAAAERAALRLREKAAKLAVKQARHEGAPTAWRAWFDGSAHPNPGRCGIGAVLTGPLGERIEISQAAGYGNSSEAEYLALIAVLEAALVAGARSLTVYGDSQVVVNDVKGLERDAAPSLQPLRVRVLALLAQLGEVALRWIPRHKNPEADALSQRAVIAISASADAPTHRGA